MAKNPGFLFCVGTAVALASASAFAQSPTANARVEQAQKFRPEASAQDSGSLPAFSLDQAPASPGDPDLGEQVILRRKEKLTPFKLFADVSGFYTSNAALTDKHTVDDFFLVAQVGASYQTQVVPNLYAEATVRQATFRYAKFDELDFDSLNAGAGLTYVSRPLWGLAFSVRYNFNRLTDGSQHDEFFKNHTVTLAVQKTYELSKAHYLYGGYASVFGWSEPVAPQRDEHGIYLGYHASLSRSISADASYRIALFDYVHGRADWNQSLTVAVKWDATRWLSIAASISGGLNHSNREVFDYKVFSGGVGITASIAF